MGLSKKKSDVINKLKLFISVANSDIENISFNDLIFNTNDPVDFLLDLAKVTIGENILETVVQNTLSQVITQQTLNKFSDSIYNSISSNLSENTTLPQSLQNGITMPIKSIDISDSFRKVNITGSSASKNTNSFFQKMVNDVLPSPNTEINLSTNINANYLENSGEINIKLPNTNQKAIFNEAKQMIGPLFSSSVIISEIINLLFHSEESGFSKEDAQILTLVRSYTKYENKDVFKLDLKKLLDLELDNQIKGLNIDTSCFRENIEITQQQIDNVIENPTIQSFNNLVPQTSGENNTSSNFKNDYHKNILKSIIEALLMIIMKQPGVLFIINLFNKLINLNDVFSVSIPEIFQKIKNLIEEIFDNVYEIFFCIIFNFIKKYIIKIVVAVTIIFLKEQLEKRSQILLSLSGFNTVQSFL